MLCPKFWADYYALKLQTPSGADEVSGFFMAAFHDEGDGLPLCE
jgi:hypothetical protein